MGEVRCMVDVDGIAVRISKANLSCKLSSCCGLTFLSIASEAARDLGDSILGKVNMFALDVWICCWLLGRMISENSCLCTIVMVVSFLIIGNLIIVSTLIS